MNLVWGVSLFSVAKVYDEEEERYTINDEGGW